MQTAVSSQMGMQVSGNLLDMVSWDTGFHVYRYGQRIHKLQAKHSCPCTFTPIVQRANIHFASSHCQHFLWPWEEKTISHDDDATKDISSTLSLASLGTGPVTYAQRESCT